MHVLLLLGQPTNVRNLDVQGVLRSEGKEYIVAEGDVMLFRFNV